MGEYPSTWKKYKALKRALFICVLGLFPAVMIAGVIEHRVLGLGSSKISMPTVVTLFGASFILNFCTHRGHVLDVASLSSIMAIGFGGQASVFTVFCRSTRTLKLHST